MYLVFADQKLEMKDPMPTHIAGEQYREVPHTLEHLSASLELRCQTILIQDA
jgi:hypothetical protein